MTFYLRSGKTVMLLRDVAIKKFGEFGTSGFSIDFGYILTHFSTFIAWGLYSIQGGFESGNLAIKTIWVLGGFSTDFGRIYYALLGFYNRNGSIRVEERFELRNPINTSTMPLQGMP